MTELDINKILGHLGESITTMFALEAEFLIQAGYADEAVHLCLEGIEQYPKYISGYTVLAKAYLVLNRVEEAIQTIEEATLKFPKNKTLSNFAQNELKIQIEGQNQNNTREVVKYGSDFIFDYSTKIYRQKLKEELENIQDQKDLSDTFDEQNTNIDNSEIDNFDTEEFKEGLNSVPNDYPKTPINSRKNITEQQTRQDYFVNVNIDTHQSVITNEYESSDKYENLYELSNSNNLTTIPGLEKFIYTDNLLEGIFSQKVKFNGIDIKKLELNSLIYNQDFTFSFLNYTPKTNINNSIKEPVRLDEMESTQISSTTQKEITSISENIIDQLNKLDSYLQDNPANNPTNFVELTPEQVNNLNAVEESFEKKDSEFNLKKIFENKLKTISYRYVEELNTDTDTDTDIDTNTDINLVKKNLEGSEVHHSLQELKSEINSLNNEISADNDELELYLKDTINESLAINVEDLEKIIFSDNQILHPTTKVSNSNTDINNLDEESTTFVNSTDTVIQNKVSKEVTQQASTPAEDENITDDGYQVDILSEVNSRLANAEYSWQEIERLLNENENRINVPAAVEEENVNQVADVTTPQKQELQTHTPISETIARIYENQEAYQDALTVYKKLIGKHPEKTDYYKKQIKRIKKIIYKSEKK